MNIDTGSSTAVPTITVEDHDGPAPQVTAKDAPESTQEVEDDAAANEIPGSMPTSPASAIPDWYRVGWRQNAGLDNVPVVEENERVQSLLETFLSEQFYGDWYHNAAVIVFVRFTRIFHHPRANYRLGRPFSRLIS